jgi:hypothetical protein
MTLDWLKTSFAAFAAAVIALNAACSEEGAENSGEGTLRIELWGEDFIEEGIPAASSPEADDGFADGYSITFDKFIIALRDISVAEEDADPALGAAAEKIWDLTESGPFPVTSGKVPAGAYDHAAYNIAPATSAAVAGNADAEAVAAMSDGGYSVLVAGTATDGSMTKTFEWAFDTETAYDPCHSTAVLEDGGKATVQITIHGDHLFYDDAVSSSPSLRFADIALADADADGQVTEEELTAYDITPLPNYGVGSLDIDNLWGFISHMTATLGHIDGEGHCE